MEHDLASFFKKILKSLGAGDRSGQGDSSEPRIYLAAFGKHPGWNDYMDDLGLESKRLVDLKRFLYLEGIGGNISEWGRLEESKHLSGFQHCFVMHSAGEVVAGRLWSSSDGMGRRLYPMMVCSLCAGCDLNWAISDALPVLAELEKQCQSATTAAEVRAFTDAARTQLQTTPPQAHSAAPLFPNILTWLSQRPEMGKDHKGLLNLLYETETKWSTTGNAGPDGSFSTRILGGSHHMRLPSCGQSPGDAIRLWLQFVYLQLDQATPVLAIVAEEMGWVDLIVGHPAASDLYCLQASQTTMPFSTDIPYNIPADFITRAQRMIRGESGQP